MKLSISNLAWSEDNTTKVYSLLKKLGYKYIEIAPTKIIKKNPYDNLEKAEEYAKNLKEKYDLEIISMQSIWFGKKELMFNSEEELNELLNYTKKAIDFAQSINCHNIVFGNPKSRNMPDYEKNYLEAIEFFKELGAYAKSKDVVIAIEPNPTIYNTNFLNNTMEAIEFVKKVGMDNVKVNYDLGTVISNAESFNTLKDYIIYINNIHISEPYLKKIEERDLHIELFKTLKELKYDKGISIEMQEQNFDDVKETLLYVKNLGDKYGI